MTTPTATNPTTIDVEQARAEFAVLKTDNIDRNTTYYLNRQAVEGNFRWPRDWPTHIPKVKHNYCKPITERFSTYLMGKGFHWNINRPNTLEFRDQAERAEKILRRLMKLSGGDVQMMHAARVGSVVGRSVFKVYKKGTAKGKHACFQTVQPDYFYGVPATDSPVGEWAKVFYSYPIDISEAVRMFGEKPYQSELKINQASRYDNLPEDSRNVASQARLARRIPVLEVWTKDAYWLEVGGVTIFNGQNPYKWSDTDEGFIPFVVIENIRNDGMNTGESDIQQARDLNEQFNYLLSRKQHIVGRWLQPTLVWEGAPQNYLDILTSTIGGGGAIPTRLGSRLYFLAYDRPNPSVTELETTLRQAILESAGLNEIAYQGTVHGYVNTGPSVFAQYQPVQSLIESKHQRWADGLEMLFAMLLQLQEDIGDSEALGLAVINASVNSKDGSDGEVVTLSGTDIAGLREVTIDWPGLLPKDDVAAAQLEMQKAAQGMQSIYTTLEKLGEEFPDDELARIRMENSDPALKGQEVAEQTRANASALSAQANAAQAGVQPDQMPEAPDLLGGQNRYNSFQSEDANAEQTLLAQGDIGSKLRALARHARPQVDNTGDEPVIGGGHPQPGAH